MSNNLRFTTTSPQETRYFGETIGKFAQAGDVYLLNGALGAGKTCLTQGIAQGLGVEGNVRSPTFVLMTRHKGRLTLHHVDLYRISGPTEAWDLGLDEHTAGYSTSSDKASVGSICVVEWAERATGIFPTDSLWLDFSYGDSEDERVIEIATGPTRYQRLLEVLLENHNNDIHPSAS